MTDFRTVVFTDRTKKIAFRADMAATHLVALQKWLDDDVPEIIREGEDAARLADSLNPAWSALADLARQTPGDFGQEWADQLYQRIRKATAAITRTITYAQPLFGLVQEKFPSHRWDTGRRGMTPFWYLGTVNSLLFRDMLWAHSLKSEVETSAKDRVRRHRARRKAGYTVHPIALHHNDIETLRRLGLLRKPRDLGRDVVGARPIGRAELDAPNTPEEITEAMQMFLEASLAAATPGGPGRLGPEPKQPPFYDDAGSSSSPSDALSWWPLFPFMRRLAALAGMVSDTPERAASAERAKL